MTISYKQLQKKAKNLNISAGGSRLALEARIRIKEETAPKVNKYGKTVAQVKKDTEAAAGLMACGRL